jgi:Rap1a immunity proteins
MRLRTLVSAAAFLLPTSAFSQDADTHATFKNGTALYEACTAASDPQKQKLAFCIGYVMGVSDSLQSMQLTCSPKEAKVKQLIDVVVNYLRDHANCSAICRRARSDACFGEGFSL